MQIYLQNWKRKKSVLKSRVSEDFRAENERELKQGLIDTINNILEDGNILDVYLVGADGTGFVVQKV